MEPRPPSIDPWEWREVLADRLCETDPARGQFAQLQLRATREPLDAAQRRRLHQLFQAHRPWIEPVASGLREGEYRFAGGYLDVANVYPRDRRHARELAESPLWSSVRQVVAPRYLPLLLKDGRFTELTTIGTAFLDHRDGTCERLPWGQPLRADRASGLVLPESVHALQVDLGTDARCRAFLNAFGVGTLADVRTAGIVAHRLVSLRMLEEFPRTLTRVVLEVGRKHEELWLTRVQQLFPQLERLEVVRGREVVPADSVRLESRV